MRGKSRCHVHGGKSSKGQTYAVRFSDFTKANLERERQIGVAIRQIDKEIRVAVRSGNRDQQLAFEGIRRGLLDIPQQTGSALAKAYRPSAAEKEAQRKDEKLLAHQHRYDKQGSRTKGRVRDRAMGAMIGLVVGEAVGLAMEDRPRGSGALINDMEGCEALRLERGYWAGDTAMSLALLQSLEFRKEFDPTDFMDRLTEWWTEGAYSCLGICIGMGEVTREALDRYDYYLDPIAGDEDPDCLDSGSLVRIAPVAIRYWSERDQLREVAARQSETTHGNIYAIEACVAFAEILARAISGDPRDIVFRNEPIKGASSIDCVRTGSWKRLHREDVRSTNNVLGLLEAALWCVYLSENFADAVLRATNLGHDAGTVAALAGQLAGALYGASGIPNGWTEDLAWHEQIREWTEPLLEEGLDC